MSKKRNTSPTDGTTRKRQYEQRKRETHRRLELRVSLGDMDRIAKIGVKRSDLVPTLLQCYVQRTKPDDSEQASSKETGLPDCGHRAWWRLGNDIRDFMGCEKPADIAFLHHLRDRVEDALLAMLNDGQDSQQASSLSLDLVRAMLTDTGQDEPA